jgi:crossover junction endodeoxyribonuclease RuvC
MLVIGIDPGIATTGYGLVEDSEDGSLGAVTYGVITTSSSMVLPLRLLELYKRLSDIVLLHQPQGGAVEKLFFQRNVRTAMNVGQARGISMLVLGQSNIPVVEYSPLEIKLAVTGYGGADKNQVQQMVRALLRLNETPRPDDAADALAVAICHLHSSRIRALYGLTS